MAIFDCEANYIVCSTGTQERLARIESIIIALENQAIIAATDSNIAEYSLNDGQVTIRTAYRNPTEIAKAIQVFENMYQTIYNRCSGMSIVSLRDARSFR